MTWVVLLLGNVGALLGDTRQCASGRHEGCGSAFWAARTNAARRKAARDRAGEEGFGRSEDGFCLLFWRCRNDLRTREYGRVFRAEGVENRHCRGYVEAIKGIDELRRDVAELAFNPPQRFFSFFWAFGFNPRRREFYRLHCVGAAPGKRAAPASTCWASRPTCTWSSARSGKS